MELGGCDFNSDSEFLKAKVMVDPDATEHPTVKGWGIEFWYEAIGLTTPNQSQSYRVSRSY